ncbi:MAG: O-antigen ligase family protein, partial [Candidatus Levybacteria bacterium]|nr:O-antigen ligase family protein [Candidatus Levybacteria bacterium]
QLGSTYFIDIYQFMRIWGERIQCNQFGNQWCDIAVQVGNTWFAYYGEQLSLRVFSLFPDSHSFPQFILLGLPAIFAIAIAEKVMLHHDNLKKMFKTRSQLTIVWVPLIFLAAILTGTRGIWAGSVGALLFGLFYIFILIRKKIKDRKNILVYIASCLTVFFLLFIVAFPIFESPQFLLSKGNSLLFGKRIRSIIDFGETSNSQRIEIWKASLESIKKHPLLGVGIGNFPIVLNQDLVLAKAGSSAHNIYLQIAAEMGIPALIFALWFLWFLMQKIYTNFITSRDWEITVYNGASLIFIPWVLIYSLTDVALFDERAFLLFVTTISLILTNKKTRPNLS